MPLLDAAILTVGTFPFVVIGGLALGHLLTTLLD